MTRTAMLALTIAIVALTSMARAEDTWVSGDGDDGAAGSRDAPWATIGFAASQVAAGDTVHVVAGDYRESILSQTSGTEAMRIVFASDAPWGARVDASGSYTAWHNTGDFVDIVGFEVTGSDYLGIYNEGSFVRIVGNHVHHLATPTCNRPNGGAAIDNGNYDAHDADTIGNVVHDVGMNLEPCNQIHGIYHSNLRGRIWNNIVYRTIAYGIHTWHNPADVVISSNLVFQNGQGGIIVGAGDSPGTGFANGFLVTNNVVIDNPVGIIEEGSFGPDNRYLDNLLFANGEDLVLGNPDEGSLFVDPALTDYQPDGSGDYRPAPGSPCIDTGVAEGAPPDDLDGVARPQGDGFDIGPFEWSPPVDGGSEEVDAGSNDAGPDEPPTPDAGGVADDGGRPPDPDGGVAPPRTAAYQAGCGCRVNGVGRAAAPPWFTALVLLAAWARRRTGRRGARLAYRDPDERPS